MSNVLEKYTLISLATIFANTMLQVKAFAQAWVETRAVRSVSADDSIFPPALDEASRCPA